MATVTFTIPDATLNAIVSDATSGSWAQDFQSSGLTAKQYVMRRMLGSFIESLKAKKRGEIVRSRQQDGITESTQYNSQLDTAKAAISAN